ncbi:MAG: vitamin K epoxide reductase family protein [Deltaproteobacteria bacterium]|nr:vitamin K epoxide reductase family protein [Deltaproteobacteria bacterium]
MGKAARKKKSGGKEVVQRSPTRPVPNWPLLGLALIGMGITAYLTATAWAGQTVAGCTEGSGCDVVLNSHWSKLFGLPISFWGFLAYASLAGIAFIKRADLHWKLAWVVSLFGVLYSIYLTGVSLVELKATCPYCLTSLGLMTVILATVAYQWPRDLPKFSWRAWLLWSVSGSLILMLVLHLHYAGMLGKSAQPEDPWVRSLAEHLAKTDAKFYGAYWCPHCNDQKEMFGSSVDRLPYIECSLQGRNAPQAAVCQAAAIETYPTWVIGGRRYEGVLTLGELARYSGFQGAFP